MAIRNTGSGDYLIRTTGGFYNPSSMTVCFWINLIVDKDASGAVFGIREAGGSIGYVYFYDLPADGVTYGWQHDGAGSLPELDVNPLSLGVWTFCALSRSGTGTNQTTAYRRTASSTSFTSQTGTFGQVGQPISEEVVLSNGFNLAGGWFPGRIAALKQWSAPLSEAELWQESQQIMPVRLADLHSWRPMADNTVAGAALDYSGNGRALTPNGALTIEDGPPIPWRQGGRRFVPIAVGAVINADARIAGRSLLMGLTSVSRLTAAQIAARSNQHALSTNNKAAQAVVAFRSGLSALGAAARQAAARFFTRSGLGAKTFEPLSPPVSVTIKHKLATRATVIDEGSE